MVNDNVMFIVRIVLLVLIILLIFDQKVSNVIFEDRPLEMFYITYISLFMTLANFVLFFITHLIDRIGTK